MQYDKCLSQLLCELIVESGKDQGIVMPNVSILFRIAQMLCNTPKHESHTRAFAAGSGTFQ